MVQLLILVALVLGIVVATARFHFSPFLVLLFAALIGALLYRIPLDEVVDTALGAFGRVLGSIVIVLGTIIGVILERFGAAISMANRIVRVIGARMPTPVMTLIGYVVSIRCSATSPMSLTIRCASPSPTGWTPLRWPWASHS